MLQAGDGLSVWLDAGSPELSPVLFPSPTLPTAQVSEQTDECTGKRVYRQWVDQRTDQPVDGRMDTNQ